MKKIAAVLAAVLVFICIFTACSGKSGSDADAIESNANEAAQQLGFTLNVPSNAENMEYFIVGGNIEELRFTVDGLDYTARLKKSTDFEDISGLNYTWTHTLDDEIKGCECRLMRYNGDDGDIDLCLWHDAAAGLMYSLTTSDRSLDGFDITAMALQVYTPADGSDQAK